MVDLVYALNQRDHREVVALRPHSGQYRRGVVELARLLVGGGQIWFHAHRLDDVNKPCNHWAFI